MSGETHVSDGQCFTLVWSIDNFEVFNWDKGWCPTFHAECLDETNWYLSLNCNEEKIGDSTDETEVYGIKLYRSMNKNDGCIAVRFEVSLPAIGYRKEKTEHFDTERAIGWQNFIEKSRISELKSNLLPRGTLVVQCRLWKSKDQVTSIATEMSTLQLQAFHSGLENQSLGQIEKVPDLKKMNCANFCFCRTPIRIQNCTFSCMVDTASLYRAQQKKVVIPVKLCGEVVLIMTIGFTEDHKNFQINVYKKLQSLEDFVKIRSIVSVQNSYAKSQVLSPLITDHILNDDSEEMWCILEKPCQKDKVFKGVDAYSLLVKFDFIFVEKDADDFIESYAYIPIYTSNLFFLNDISNSYILNNLKGTFSDTKYCDVILRAGNESIPVHRVILSASSSVFDAMFSSEMRENETRTVDVTDIRPEILKVLLLYIYTESTGEPLDVDKTLELFAASDKYDVQAVVGRCVQFLKLNLTTANVCKVLQMADDHSNTELFLAASDFICTHSSVVLVSAEWKQLAEERVSLASKILAKVTQHLVAFPPLIFKFQNE